MTKLLHILLATMLLGLSSCSQGSDQGFDLKHNPKVNQNNSMQDVRPPNVTHEQSEKTISGKFSNGIRYTTYPTSEHKNQFLLAIQFNVGANDNPKGQYGLAHLVEHLVLEATRKVINTNSQSFIADDLNLGHNINGATDFETTTCLTSAPMAQIWV